SSAGVGQSHATRMSLEKRHADLRFERAYAIGDVRLDGIELTGSACNSTAACDRRKGLEIRQLHRSTVLGLRTQASKLIVSRKWCLGIRMLSRARQLAERLHGD